MGRMDVNDGSQAPSSGRRWKRRATVWAALVMASSSGWSADRVVGSSESRLDGSTSRAYHVGSLPEDASAGLEARHARYDTVDAPLPAFRIPLHSTDRPAIVDPHVVRAGASSKVVLADTAQSGRIAGVRPKPLATGTIPIPRAGVTRVSGNASTWDAPLELPKSSNQEGAEPLRLPPAPSATESIPSNPIPSALPPELPLAESPIARVPSNESASGRSDARRESMTEVSTGWPTVIYRSSSVVLAVPDVEMSRVRGLRLKKTSGDDVGMELDGEVVDGRATFHSLTSGTYEVTYLPSGGGEMGSRRIIIELEKPPEPLALDFDRKPTLRAEAVVVDETLEREVDATWDRLERGASYSSLQRFQQIVTSHAREVEGEESSTDLVRILAGQMSPEMLEKSGRFTRLQVAEAWAKQLGGRAELANAVYGLGRAYEMVETEPRPLLAETGRLAELCYQTADLLDATLPGPLRDLGLRLLDRGLEEAGGDALRRAAACAPDAETLLALGHWHARRNEIREATAAFEEAHRLDPTFLPALLERAKWSMVPSSGAIYPSELRELTSGLKQLSISDEIGLEDRQWAMKQSTRLTWMEREIDANLAGFSSKRWGSKSSPPTVAAERPRSLDRSVMTKGEVARTIPTAVAPNRTVSAAVAEKQPFARGEIASVRPVVSGGTDESKPSVLPSGGMISPMASESAARSVERVPIPRAGDEQRTIVGANSSVPIRIPAAIPRSSSSMLTGDNR